MDNKPENTSSTLPTGCFNILALAAGTCAIGLLAGLNIQSHIDNGQLEQFSQEARQSQLVLATIKSNQQPLDECLRSQQQDLVEIRLLLAAIEKVVNRKGIERLTMLDDGLEDGGSFPDLRPADWGYLGLGEAQPHNMPDGTEHWMAYHIDYQVVTDSHGQKSYRLFTPMDPLDLLTHPQ